MASPSVVLVTGASGMLGRAVMRVLARQAPQWAAVGLSFSRSGPGLRQCDLTDRAAVQALWTEVKPEFVVHCAAERRPDKCDGTSELALNQAATLHLAELTAADTAWCGRIQDVGQALPVVNLCPWFAQEQVVSWLMLPF